jgi:hypothetical protein
MDDRESTKNSHSERADQNSRLTFATRAGTLAEETKGSHHGLLTCQRLVNEKI